MTAFLEPAMADRLGAMRGPDESFSEVILRLVKMEARA
jgi:predicted CopG family antitoxin